jgi:membrane-associated protease RseP (regulator of RpoE activity)
VGGPLAIAGFLALILLVVIPIHELGHLLVAKRFGFKIQEYFVGFGPKLWSMKRGETEYGIKAIPAGGYVKIAGMNPYESVPPADLARAYGSKPIWQRTLVILAGPLSHLLVGAVLYFSLFVTYGDPNTDLVVVGEVASTLDGSTSPAAAAGLRVGDIVIRVGDLERPTPDSLGAFVTRYARDHRGESLTYVIERDGRRLSFEIVPRLVREDEITKGRIGFTLGAEPLSISRSAVFSGEWVGRATWASVETIPKIFTVGVGRTFSVLFTDEPRRGDDVTSLVGVSRQIGDAGERGDWGLFLGFAAYVTIFIGVVNLIPLPPLDGGHLLLLAWERITGRQADYRKLIPVSAAVIVFLSIFAIATVFLDITEPLPLI